METLKGEEAWCFNDFCVPRRMVGSVSSLVSMAYCHSKSIGTQCLFPTPITQATRQQCPCRKQNQVAFLGFTLSLFLAAFLPCKHALKGLLKDRHACPNCPSPQTLACFLSMKLWDLRSFHLGWSFPWDFWDPHANWPWGLSCWAYGHVEMDTQGPLLARIPPYSLLPRTLTLFCKETIQPEQVYWK